MHIDWMTVTVPSTHAVLVHDDVRDLLSAVGCIALLPLGGMEKYQHPTGGSFMYRSYSRGFSVFSASGDILRVLRERGVYDQYLGCYFDVPHKVTRLDIAHDVETSAPAVLRKLESRYLAGSITLSRKALKRTQCNWVRSLDKQGKPSGTVYLGSRKAEVRCRVYDKVLERASKGIVIDGPLLRYELTVTNKAGASLKDASEPEGIFWRFMSDVLQPPKNVPDWEPGAMDYDLPSVDKPLPAEVLKRFVAESGVVGQLLDLCDACGPEGFSYLVATLKRAYDDRSRQT